MSKPKYKPGDRVNGYTIISYLGNGRYETICNTCNKHRKWMTRSIIEHKTCSHIYKWQYPELHTLFKMMYARCYLPYTDSYKYYGGRSIKIEDCWLNNHGYFEEWCIENGYEHGLQIDRIDVNSNYGPSNCRFVSNIDNQNNKRNNLYLTANGITLTASEWRRKLNIHGTCTIHEYYRRNGKKLTEQRLEQGWPKVNHFRQSQINITINGTTQGLSQWSLQCGFRKEGLYTYYYKHGLEQTIQHIQSLLDKKAGDKK